MTLGNPESQQTLVDNRVFPSGIPTPAGNRDVSKSRKSLKSRRNDAFQSRLSKKIAASLKKQDSFKSSLKQAIFGLGSETAPGSPQCPTSAFPCTPFPELPRLARGAVAAETVAGTIRKIQSSSASRYRKIAQNSSRKRQESYCRTLKNSDYCRF